jgi:hypothetical protein
LGRRVAELIDDRGWIVDRASYPHGRSSQGHSEAKRLTVVLNTNEFLAMIAIPTKGHFRPMLPVSRAVRCLLFPKAT